MKWAAARWPHGPGLWGMAALQVLAGCARLAPKVEAPVPPAATEVAEDICAPEITAAATNGPVLPDPEKVTELQMQALAYQRRCEDGDPPPKQNSFTARLDRYHESLFVRMDNAVRRFDSIWMKEESNYAYRVSTFRLSSLARVGGRSNEDDYQFKVRFNAKLALPALEREMYFFIDNAGRDDLPGSDALKQDDDTRIGLRSVRHFFRRTELEAGGGIRLRASGPVAYGDLEWRWTKEEVASGELKIVPRGYYYTDDGFGQVTTVTWTRPVGPRKKLQFRLAERSSETTSGLEFEQTVRFAWFRSGRGRGWVAQASAFPHWKDSSTYWDNYLVNLTWRDALFRKWIYYTVMPQVEVPQEDDYDARPSLRIGLEVLFGGQTAELM